MLSTGRRRSRFAREAGPGATGRWNEESRWPDLLGEVVLLVPDEAGAEIWRLGEPDRPRVETDWEPLEPVLAYLGGLSGSLAPRRGAALHVVPSVPALLTRTSLVDGVSSRPAWAVVEIREEAAERTVDVHVAWLRKAVERNPSRPRYLLTVRGVGYRFEG